ncbi:pyridoxamine 5'-phosphate oxidase [Nonomuraea deserti]|uniref:Pyridoxamine 5'-phosphate oxidase n=1 Tax=Nonomuraea deserti TaxID=1848322 RepID=A0A4R4VJV9_9ACTN|nr:pyridoxamine 5'-phosphate oxidase family protein [Nonomuraea deserti]TDD00160.1 pyridoxamine 5'-phosphate oxidase [Nonomuraea deserti]
MEINEQSRTPERRTHDVLNRLERERDIWVASAAADGVPYLVPLWFVWHGQAVWLSTRATNPTGRNLRNGGRTRLALADTQDVVLIDGVVKAFAAHEVAEAAAGTFGKKYGWDPRKEDVPYAFFEVRPRTIQAWHVEREFPGRILMREGVWVA